MNAIKATVKNRQVLVEVPADWPEGCEVIVEPIATPQGDEDDAAWRAALQEQKEYEKARFFEDALVE